MIKLQNDATLCYDRMICNVTTLYNCSYSDPEKVCELHAKSLNNMKFKIQTALGVSNRTHTNRKTDHCMDWDKD